MVVRVMPSLELARLLVVNSMRQVRYADGSLPAGPRMQCALLRPWLLRGLLQKRRGSLTWVRTLSEQPPTPRKRPGSPRRIGPRPPARKSSGNSST